jgi:predicted ATP-dependent protease
MPTEAISPPSRLSIPPTPPAARARCAVTADHAAVVTAEACLAAEGAPAPPLVALSGPHAMRALGLGFAAVGTGFHVFVSSPHPLDPGVDIAALADEATRVRPRRLEDFVLVHGLERPVEPVLVALPAGASARLERVLAKLGEVLPERLARVEEDQALASARDALQRELEDQEKAVVAELEQHGKEHGFAVRAAHGQLQIVPRLHGKPVSQEQFDVLDEPTRRRIEEARARLEPTIDAATRQLRQLGLDHGSKRRALQQEAASARIREALEEAKANLGEGLEGALPWLEELAAHVEAVWPDLLATDGRAAGDDPWRDLFRVEVLLARSEEDDAPVVVETDPSEERLFGYVEREWRGPHLAATRSGVRVGALLEAAGGVLVLRVEDVVARPEVWRRLMRALRDRRFAVEDLAGRRSLVPATALRPTAVDLDVLVVLVGSPGDYEELSGVDTDFTRLFRVKVELESECPRTPENVAKLDAHLAGRLAEAGVPAPSIAGRARLLDVASWLADDRERLTLDVDTLVEIAKLAALDASKLGGAGEVDAATVDRAYRERRQRSAQAERHFRELTQRGVLAIATAGERVGVINGLSVYSTGEVDFGQPVRLTAVVSLGREGIIDVEREAQLGGAIHTKGVAILRGYLGHMFGQERPLSLRAQLAFEQSYGEIDGDSASTTELFALLSALAELPIDQGIAVTGSTNQLGEVQAIGGLSAKIESFYDLCASRGLTGAQGVVFPRANLPQLALHGPVLEAIASGRFHLYAIDDISEGVEILMNTPAGERDDDGHFPADSVFGRVERRLIEVAERLRHAEGGPSPDGDLGPDAEGGEGGEGGAFRSGPRAGMRAASRWRSRR